MFNTAHYSLDVQASRDHDRVRSWKGTRRVSPHRTALPAGKQCSTPNRRITAFADRLNPVQPKFNCLQPYLYGSPPPFKLLLCEHMFGVLRSFMYGHTFMVVDSDFTQMQRPSTALASVLLSAPEHQPEL